MTREPNPGLRTGWWAMRRVSEGERGLDRDPAYCNCVRWLTTAAWSLTVATRLDLDKRTVIYRLSFERSCVCVCVCLFVCVSLCVLFDLNPKQLPLSLEARFRLSASSVAGFQLRYSENQALQWCSLSILLIVVTAIVTRSLCVGVLSGGIGAE